MLVLTPLIVAIVLVLVRIAWLIPDAARELYPNWGRRSNQSGWRRMLKLGPFVDLDYDEQSGRIPQ